MKRWRGLEMPSLKRTPIELRGHPIRLRGRGKTLIWAFLSEAKIKRPCRFTRRQADRRDCEFIERVTRDIWEEE